MVKSLDRLEDAKVLIYSHDSFGLGHLRRCRTIAHSLVDAYKGLSVLILSGSPIISQFDFKSRVDFIRIPGVVKLRNGDYTSLGLHIDLDKTLAMRASIIQHTAEIFAPDIFLVDKEPLGLREEVAQVLRIMKLRGTINVLGLRDIMDESEALEAEWERKAIIPKLDKLYDEIWVYGSKSIANPVQGIDLPKNLYKKFVYLGYLKRVLPAGAYLPKKLRNKKYILITAGGGGDGKQLVDWVVRAYQESSDHELIHGLVLLGPFMPKKSQRKFRRRIRKIKNLSVKTFASNLEILMNHARGVVGMGGYNTFCEILSFDKKAILVPRESPRLEQYIRAEFAEAHGLVSVLRYGDFHDTGKMIEALKQLPDQPLPSESNADELLGGLENLNKRVADLIAAR